MQRMHNLDKWSRLEGDRGLHFTNPRPRPVRIEVNTPVKAQIYLIDHTGEVHFLALVEGRDTIEFHSYGAFSLTSETDGVMIYTADGDDISSQIVDPVIFTRIATRRARNPEMEYLNYMARTMEARFEQHALELARRYEGIAEASMAKAQPMGVVPESPVEPEPQDGAVLHGGASSEARRTPEASGGEGGGAGAADKPAKKLSGGDKTPSK